MSRLTCALRAAFPVTETLVRRRSVNKGGGLNTNDVENLIVICHGTSVEWYYANLKNLGGVEEE